MKKNRPLNTEVNVGATTVLSSTISASTIFTSHCITIAAPQQTVPNSTVAYQENSSKKHQTTYSTWLSFEKESYQVQDHEHYMCV